MKRAPPPPTTAAPISQEVVAIVKKKLAAPKGPPPAGLASFKPKAPQVSAPAPPVTAPRKDEDDDSYYNDRNERGDADGEDQYEYDSDGDYSRGGGSRDSREEDRMRELERAEHDDPTPVAKPGSASGSSAAPATIFGGMMAAASKAAPPAKAAGGGVSAALQGALSLATIQGEPTSVVPGSLLPQRMNRANKAAAFNFTPILKVTYRELRQFVMSPIQPGIIVRCYIERDRSGMNMFSPTYSLCADLEDGTGRELLACRKMVQSRSSHYVFSLKSDDLWRKREQRSRLFLGKLRAKSANEYVLYDNGSMSAPEGMKEREPTAEEDGKADEGTLYRRELAVIWLNTKTRPAPAGVRGTEIAISGSFLTSDQIAVASGNASSASGGAQVTKLGADSGATSRDLSGPFSRIRSAGKQNSWQPKTCFVLHERTSRYDPLSSCLVDFKGRANVASIKNCQFVESGPQVRGVPLTAHGGTCFPLVFTYRTPLHTIDRTAKGRRVLGQMRTRTLYCSWARPPRTASTWITLTRSVSSKPLPFASPGSMPSLVGDFDGWVRSDPIRF